MPQASTATRTRWTNWAGNQSAHPARTATPGTAEELAKEILRAAEQGRSVKAAGSGHSFTAIASPGDGLLVRPHALTAVREIDREAGTVTVESGLPLSRLNRILAAEGLSLTNMGDIEVQTVAGATSTGTHGTGRDSGSLAAQVRALEIVLADGTVVSDTARLLFAVGSTVTTEQVFAGADALGAVDPGSTGSESQGEDQDASAPATEATSTAAASGSSTSNKTENSDSTLQVGLMAGGGALLLALIVGGVLLARRSAAAKAEAFEQSTGGRV